MKHFQPEKDPQKLTPVVNGFKCKALMYAIFFALTFLPLLIGVYVWHAYDWLISIGVVLFLYLVSSIVSSKLRFSSLPPQQRERSLSSLEIARWYVYQHFCY